MSYTPTEWATGDIVTAEKLNKLENGVQEAGELPKQSGIVTFEVTTLNFPSNQQSVIGYFWYVRKVEDAYQDATVLASPITLWVNGNFSKAVFSSTYPVPSLDDLYLIFVVPSSVDVTNHSGGISENPVSVPDVGQAYVITGDFSIEFTYLG